MHYLDTSIIVPFYVPERKSTKVERFLTEQTDLSVSVLTEVEFVSAISKKVRIKELAVGDANRVTTLLQDHIDDAYFLKLSLDHTHYELARDLLNRFDLTLNSLDALHLSVALSGKMTFVTLDKNLYKAAKTLGIPTIDISKFD